MVCWLLQLTSHAAWSDRPRPTRRPLGHEARHGRPGTTRHGPCAARAAWPRGPAHAHATQCSWRPTHDTRCTWGAHAWHRGGPRHATRHLLWHGWWRLLLLHGLHAWLLLVHSWWRPAIGLWSTHGPRATWHACRRQHQQYITHGGDHVTMLVTKVLLTSTKGRVAAEPAAPTSWLCTSWLWCVLRTAVAPADGGRMPPGIAPGMGPPPGAGAAAGGPPATGPRRKPPAHDAGRQTDRQEQVPSFTHNNTLTQKSQSRCILQCASSVKAHARRQSNVPCLPQLLPSCFKAALTCRRTA